MEQLERTGLVQRLRQGLTKTHQRLADGFGHLLHPDRDIDEQFWEELEEVLILADVGVAATNTLIEELRGTVRQRGLQSADQVYPAVGEHVRTILRPYAQPFRVPLGGGTPYVVMVVGVNGSGKTTTIGKLAHIFGAQGMKVVLAAADTFRAAAAEQLEIWGTRTGATVITHQAGGDPSAVAYDALAAATARGSDLVLVDTAGRLHTKENLMEELKKVKRVMGKQLPGSPHEILLVVDATNGQNAVAQARTFRDAIGVTGLALTKLDGTSKGGILIAIAREVGIPVRFVGVGEGVNDLQVFSADEFAEALFTQTT